MDFFMGTEIYWNMFGEGNNCKIVYNRIRDTVGNNCKLVYNCIPDTVAPFLVTVTIGLYGYKPTIVSGLTWLLLGPPTVKLPRTRSDLGGLSRQISDQQHAGAPSTQPRRCLNQCYSVHCNCNHVQL
jgi:hypothetical protein